MDSINYNDCTQTLVGEKTKTLVDTETGEYIEVKQIVKRIYGTKNFWKCYLMDFLQILGILESKQVDVLVYILENTRQSDNLFIGTYRKIAKDVNVSEPTIARLMKKLQAHHFVTKVQNGLWMVNPSIMMKGNDHKRQMLLSYYNAENPIDAITKPKIKPCQSEDELGEEDEAEVMQ